MCTTQTEKCKVVCSFEWKRKKCVSSWKELVSENSVWPILRAYFQRVLSSSFTTLTTGIRISYSSVFYQKDNTVVIRSHPKYVSKRKKKKINWIGTQINDSKCLYSARERGKW